MATMNVSLPDPLKEWVDTQTQTGRYADAGDYVRDLIRRDQKRADEFAALQRSITEGLESGVSGQSMTEMLEVARNRATTTPKR